MWKKKKKKAQFTVKFEADLVKQLPKQPKEYGALARFIESQWTTLQIEGMVKAPRDSNNIIKLML